MKSYMCKACGTQYTPSNRPPDACKICEDERQYVGMNGQEWTTMEALEQTHEVEIKPLNDKLHELTLKPPFAIGQRALLYLSDKGNVLWDCLPLLNGETEEFIRSKGGLAAIAISHPHYYSSMNEWAKTFNCPLYLHRDDQQWICRQDPNVEYVLWEGREQNLLNELRLYNTRGHFDGSTILLIPEAQGILLTGDSIYVNPDRQTISCMYSYPNNIPLRKSEIDYIQDLVIPLPFDAMFSAFSFGNIPEKGKEAFRYSMSRYKRIYG